VSWTSTRQQDNWEFRLMACGNVLPGGLFRRPRWRADGTLSWTVSRTGPDNKTPVQDNRTEIRHHGVAYLSKRLLYHGVQK